MPGPHDLDPASSPRAMLGAELRFRRKQADKTQDELGAPLFVSGSFIGQLEAGTRRMQPEQAREIDRVLGTDGYFERNCRAGTETGYPDHFIAAAEAEATATQIRQYAPLLIPGLLQTERYARAVSRGFLPTATAEDIEALVAPRLERARLLTNPTKPLLWTVLDESVLRRRIGGPAIMAEALGHIAGLARRHRIVVQVLPHAAGAHPASNGALKLMSFEDAPPLAYLEGLGTGQLVDDPGTVANYQLTYDFVVATALPPESSLALIESTAEDYGHDDQ
ncbi:helix-turn-helix transcriptional regulator [Streptomyces sp. NRRL S-87]|uniref:helix-turn-helix domain-containing protein n=1 Tax=Streptomyces sp. NRRL S-87 TaxID=1463920 RepID=UPI0004BFB775|nr:helix-turn-helix transcriptional regulator [Streptomyces sp. NRRL S-87]